MASEKEGWGEELWAKAQRLPPCLVQHWFRSCWEEPLLDCQAHQKSWGQLGPAKTGLSKQYPSHPSLLLPGVTSHPTVTEWLKNLIHILRRLNQMHSCGETSLLCPMHTWALSLRSLWLSQRAMLTLALWAGQCQGQRRN